MHEDELRRDPDAWRRRQEALRETEREKRQARNLRRQRRTNRAQIAALAILALNGWPYLLLLALGKYDDDHIPWWIYLYHLVMFLPILFGLYYCSLKYNFSYRGAIFWSFVILLAPFVLMQCMGG